MNDIPIQDYVLISYSVICDKKEIHLVAEYQDQGERFGQINIQIKGIWAYLFNGDNLNTLLYAIEECTIDEVLKDYHIEFVQGCNVGWPGSWNSSPEEALKFLKGKNARAWKLVSSTGMGGFMIGDKVQYSQNENCSSCRCTSSNLQLNND